MPELPEVETIRRQLEPVLVGRRIERMQVFDELFSRPHSPADLERAVSGRSIEAFRRRGKYMLLDLEGGVTLVLHLRMTGNLQLAPAVPEPRFLRALIRLDGDETLTWTDARRFGHGEVVPTAELDEWFAGRLGVEPLSEEFTPELLLELAAGRTTPLKSFLLAQDRVAGIGNIYADEALWRAKLHPLSPAGSLKPEHAAALRDGIVGALEAGLDNGGASIDDYLDARGMRGSMQDEFLVHRREGEECLRCDGIIQRIVVSGRSTYYCAGCQVRLRKRPRRRRKKVKA
ncbi:MAG: formamidopyrimidine-DNA glycosylase [Solirubrobacterales bacterium]|jgi:formamidopyrimidine-DNA glycosylase|nr:formamidopyrimidine-DNA glycosylase [Solirubrobacterales bacterium]